MTVTSDQALQTDAPTFMPIKKKSQKQLKKRKRARALEFEKAWLDRLEVAAAAISYHTPNEQITPQDEPAFVEQCDCSQDEPEVVEQCDDGQGQAVIESHVDVKDDEREQRKCLMTSYDGIMAR